jgi:SAM-dependent methyltransferase
VISVDPAAEEAELRAYLGDAYDHERLMRSERQLVEEYERLGDERLLYRQSVGYLYDLTVFAMTQTKVPYLETLTRLVPPPARVLDYGCGIGSDGLRLIEAGYEVSFADFDNPSTRYLRWRLEQRGLDARVYDLDAGPPPAGHDAVYCFDVIEHVEDPFAFVGLLEASAALVCVNFLAEEPDDIALHHALPVRGLLARAARQGLVRYRRYHGRSHLVLYRPGPGGPLSLARSLPALAGGLLRAARG